VVDKGRAEILDDLFASDCVIHRPEMPEPVVGLEAFERFLGRFLDVYSEFATTVHDLIAEDDRVACRLVHRAVYRGDWTSRIGRHAVAGKPVRWSAIVIFRFRDGKIAEEWVCRDELGMLIDLGLVSSSKTSS
jgi:predicted ester cyclase